MALIKVYHSESLIAEISLDPNRTYVIGRSPDCDIQLENEQGISREHAKLYFDGSTWRVDLLSQYGNLSINDLPIESGQVDHGVQFEIHPYAFTFESPQEQPVEESPEEEEVEEQVPQEEHHDQKPQVGQLVPVVTEEPPQPGPVFDNDYKGSDDATYVAVMDSNKVPYIKILNDQHQVESSRKLEGNLWTAGRDPDCAISIDDGRVSRHQFEIIKTSAAYYIRDLGSVNGTLLNGALISNKEPVALNSGDMISVLNHHFYFEIRDLDIEQKMRELQPQQISLPMIWGSEGQQAMYPQQWSPHQMDSAQDHIPDEEIEEKNWKEKIREFDYKKNKVRIAIALCLMIIVGTLLTDGENKKAKQNIGDATPFSKLKPEQRELVKTYYNFAKQYFTAGKYQLANSETKKLHEIIEYYKDSKDIEEFSSQAIMALEERRLIEKQKREREELQSRIEEVIALCRSKMTNRITVSEVQGCLSPAMELDPENVKIQALILEATALEEEKLRKMKEKELYQERVQRSKVVYYRAQKLHDQGELLEAMAAYERYVHSSLPDTKGFKGKARRGIASIKKTIKVSVDKILRESQKKIQVEDLKGAMTILYNGKKYDPRNERINNQIRTLGKKLTKKMRVLYQEAILEESMGNIEAAKVNWEKILKSDMKNGKYAKKARIKLNKYGGY